MREKVSAGESLIEVELIDMSRPGERVKVRRLSEPHKGLEEYVRTRQLLVPWGERQAFLKDEENERRFDKARQGYNQALATAIETVMAATGYSDGGADDDGCVHMDAVELREVARLAGLPQNLEDLHEAAYVDRHGDMHLPVEVAEQLARVCALAEPRWCSCSSRTTSTSGGPRATRLASASGTTTCVRRRGFALARYWAGHEEEVAQLRAEIERMRELALQAAKVLEQAGQEREGRRLRRALEGK